MQIPALGHGISVADLYRREALVRLDRLFLSHLAQADAPLHQALMDARAQPAQVSRSAASDLAVRIGPILETFIAELFGVGADVARLAARHTELDLLFRIKREFVQRQAAKKIKADEAAQIDGEALHGQLQRLLGGDFDELAFARQVGQWRTDEAAHAEPLAMAERYAAWAVHTPQGRERHRAGLLFKIPSSVDPLNLVRSAEQHHDDGVSEFRIRPEHIRRRNGFALTDAGFDLAGALDQAHYCIQCHPQKKDSCSDGLKERASKEAPEVIVYKKSAFGATLAGCPLEEKISEFHMLKTQGFAIGALAVMCVDNPMVAGTRHRICNDCMKACIFQKQEPVNIPQVETRTLKDVLE